MAIVDAKYAKATGRPRYTQWSRVPEDLKTMTQWRKAGYKLNVEAIPFGYALCRDGYAELFNMECVVECTHRRQPVALELTPENVAAALYEVNKSAKRHRDAASTCYSNGLKAMAHRMREEKDCLYKIKADVLAKALQMGIAAIAGIHIKEDVEQVRMPIEPPAATLDDIAQYTDEDYFRDDEDQYDEDPYEARARERTYWRYESRTKQTYMELISLAGFRFHRIMDVAPEGAAGTVTDLGAWLSAASAKPRLMTLMDAKATLQAFLVAS